MLIVILALRLDEPVKEIKTYNYVYIFFHLLKALIAHDTGFNI